MKRDDFVIYGCGGGGGALTDTIVSLDSKYISYFINSSRTDLESLDNYDEDIANYLCVSNQLNGMGRNRKLCKKYSSKRIMNILDVINSYHQKIIYLAFSFGGGSGNAIVSVILAAIQKMKQQNIPFDKTINLIGILPTIDSSSDILSNSIESWNEIMAYTDCINSMIFVDNNNTIDGQYVSEEDINENFAQIFDSLFDIPVVNGRNFDNGNLGKILNAKGCLHIYELPSGYNSVEQALKEASKNSVLAKMYESNEVYDIDESGRKRIKCSYIGTSFTDENYTHEEVLNRYKHSAEDFQGYNENTNLVLLSGCYPPFYSIQVIMAELEEREKERLKETKTDFSKFIVNAPTKIEETNRQEIKNEIKKEVTSSVEELFKPKSNNPKKKMLKKNIFEI